MYRCPDEGGEVCGEVCARSRRQPAPLPLLSVGTCTSFAFTRFHKLQASRQHVRLDAILRLFSTTTTCHPSSPEHIGPHDPILLLPTRVLLATRLRAFLSGLLHSTSTSLSLPDPGTALNTAHDSQTPPARLSPPRYGHWLLSGQRPGVDEEWEGRRAG